MAERLTDGGLADALLPGNSTAYEEALLQAMVDAWPLDVEAIARERDPMRCREANLPFLFFQRGGTYWNDAWPLAKKRAYVRDLPVYKRLEGTMLGVELYANLEGALVLREELPPGRVAAVKNAGLTHDQELALMPQLRLYHYPPAPVLPRAYAAAGRMVVGRSAVPRPRAPVLPRRAVIYEPRTGAETPLDAVDVSSDGRTVTLAQRGTRGHAMVVGRSAVGRASLSRTVRPPPIVIDLFDPRMETISVTEPAHWRIAAAGRGRFVLGRSAVPSAHIALGTYDRLILSDPSRVQAGAGKLGRAMVVGHRIGVRPYRGFVELYVPGERPPFRGGKMAVGHFAVVGRRLTNLHNAMRAMEAARRPGDQLLITLTGKRPGARPAPIPAIGDLAV